MMEMRGISTYFPLDYYFRIVVFMTFGYNLLTACLVPLHNRDGLMLCKRIIRRFDFEFINMCCDTSERSNELNNAVE